MRTSNHRVVLITGASSGIGQTCGNYLYQRGYRVYGTSRHAKMPARVDRNHRQSASFILIPMDVTDEVSVRQGVDFVMQCEERLDVVVNNAGIVIAGAVEDTALEEAQYQFETNFFGVIRVCRAVLPIMRQQGGGYIVNISSLGGLMGLPFQGLYSASKFAIEGLSEALRMEVRPYGIRVVMIEPGDTHPGTKRFKTQAAQADTVYVEQCNKAVGVMEADEMNGESPDKVVHLLERIITHPTPRLRYTVGPLPERIAVTAKKLIPSSVFEWGVMKYYKLL